MGIAPNTELYLLKGIPLDSDYSNTIHFENLQEQRHFFMQNNRVIKYFYNSVDLQTKALYYQRKDEGVLCVGLSIAQCFNCNYIAFKNNSHESKWFYAFVTKVEYANEKACYIHYEIDVMQTWMFDYELGMSFIERQHHPTDELGANRVPENLECGEYICTNKTDYDLSKMCVALVTSKELPKKDLLDIIDNALGFKVDQTLFTEKTYGCGDSPSGVFNSLYCYSGFTLKADEEYFIEHINEYNIQSILVPLTGPDSNTDYTRKPISLETVLNEIVKGTFEGFNESSIVAVYQYPAWLDKKGGIAVDKKGIHAETFELPFTKSIKGYQTIKNHKLLTAPYSFIRCSNNAGSTAEYHFEDFTTPSFTPSFRVLGTIVNPPCLMCVPENYRNIVIDYDNGLVLNSFPLCAYTGDAYGQWITENKASLSMSVLTSVIGAIVGGAIGGATLGAATTAMSQISATGAVIGSISGGASAIGGKLAKVGDLKNTPPTVYGQIQCESLNTGFDRVKFTFYHMTVRPEMARIIDDYFTMYGYATNTVDIPNITSRPHWNFIKTINANILPTSTTCIPSDDLHRIRAVYDHGVTFWHNGEEVGDYSFDNSPIATNSIEEEN